MRGNILTLDHILSAALFFASKWTPELKRNQSRDILRFLLCRLYDQSRGKLRTSHITLAQTTLARKLGLSRQWVGTLLTRLQSEGWIEFSSPVLDHGMRGSTVFRIGRQVQRVLVMLIKSNPRKNSINSAVKERWQFSPSKEEKKLLQTQKKEMIPPPPEVFSRFPLLKTWLERGKNEIPKKES
jgi:DNA-binding Lrp family transcriptional regulator